MAEYKHNKKHNIDSTTDHNGISGATEDNIITLDALGLPQDSGIASSNITLNKFDATTAPGKSNDGTEGYSVGSMWVDILHKQIYRCVDITTDDARWRMEIGVGTFVVNKSGSTINKGKVVYQSGSQGGTPTIELAKADVEATSAGTWGIVVSGIGEENISNNGFGYILSNGTLSNVDTSTFSDGDLLFLSDSVAGGYQITQPSSPSHAVFIGRIGIAQNDGSIFVRIHNGEETYELHDVSNTPPDTTGQSLIWDNVATIYKPTDFVAGNGHITINWADGATPSITFTVVSVLNYSPIGIEFGNTNQNYDISGTTWVSAVAGGSLGGVPDETSDGHHLSDCLTAIGTALDGTYLSVREGTGVATATNPNTIHFLFENITSFDTLNMRSYYNGSVSHVMAIELWNWTTSSWTRIDTFSGQSEYVTISEKILGSSNFVGTGANEGDVILQLIHTNSGINSHHIEIDYISISDGGGGGGSSVVASSVDFIPYGNISSTNVQTALQELDDEKDNQEVEHVIKVIDDNITLTVGDGLGTFTIPEKADGRDLIYVRFHVYTASSSGLPTFQLYNVTKAVDMLTTRVTIDVGEKDSTTATTAYTINTSNDNVNVGDEIRIDVDVAGTGTKGCEVETKYL